MTQLKLAGRDDSDEETQRDHARDRFHNTVKLGQGAEGRAFRAQDSELERDVIVKVVVSADRDITSNVENLRRLNHPNISKLLDYKVLKDEWGDDQHIIVTQNVNGTSLSDILSEGCVNERQLKRIYNQVMDALDYTHEEGIIHRDIKPGNLIIQDNLHVKIIDWGVSKQTNQKTNLITLGVAGTYGYMAPEMGPDASEAVDHYSLGATLIAAASGVEIGILDEPSDLERTLEKLNLSQDFKNKIRALIEENPEKREEYVKNGYRVESSLAAKSENKSGWLSRKVIYTGLALGLLTGGVSIGVALTPESQTSGNQNIEYIEDQGELERLANLKADTNNNGILERDEYIRAANDSGLVIPEYLLKEEKFVLEVGGWNKSFIEITDPRFYSERFVRIALNIEKANDYLKSK
jgi:serine/threonine protein kinase